MKLTGVVPNDPETMLARLVRGSIAMAITASVPADQSSYRLADAVKGGKLSYMALPLQREHITYRSLVKLTGTYRGGPERPSANASSPGTRLHRHGHHCSCARSRPSPRAATGSPLHCTGFKAAAGSHNEVKLSDVICAGRSCAGQALKLGTAWHGRPGSPDVGTEVPQGPEEGID